jgi:hypothetical protein
MMPKDNNNQMPESMYISSIQDNYLANFSPSIAEPDGTYYALRHHAYQK